MLTVKILDNCIFIKRSDKLLQGACFCRINFCILAFDNELNANQRLSAVAPITPIINAEEEDEENSRLAGSSIVVGPVII